VNRSLFGFIFQHSKRQQVILILTIACSYPFYYFSLDLPKTIINEAISGDIADFPKTLFGYELEQIDFLLALCFTFLCLVLFNGAFKYFINVFRGVLSERMLRRLRYLLIERILRFPLPHFRNISQGEIVSMITAETEPVGGFIGDSLSLPAFQGGMLITALIFMFVQDPVLGIAAIVFYPIQAWVIPKLQRRVNLLNKERILHVRKLSERIDEIVSGASEIHAHDTSQYELADISDRLGSIFSVRFQVFRKKFFIKFLNNFLAQITPFFFYSIGGYLVITGDLSIGALVAVLAAYKDLGPPWKELLNYYQRMEDAKIKYGQLMERFDAPDMYPDELMKPSQEGGEELTGKVVASNITLEEDAGNRSLENAGFEFDMDEHIAITGYAGETKSAVARLIARQIMPTSGSMTIGGKDVTLLPEYVTGRQLGYVDQVAYIQSGTIGDNLLYPLKHHPQGDIAAQSEVSNKLRESELSGNSTLDIDADWLDKSRYPDIDDGEFLARIIQVLKDVDLEDEILALGIRSTVDPSRHPDLPDQILKARDLIQERMNAREFKGLVESWDRDRYNSNASVAENILYGTPLDNSFDIEALGENEFVLSVLTKVGLYDDFIEMGQGVASLMVELFQDIPPGHEYFERFSFISADDLPVFQAIVNVSARQGVAALGKVQREQLVQLPFKLIKAKHRLGFIDADLEKRLLAARQTFADEIPSDLLDKISFFDRNLYNPASSVIDNLLFGKVDSGVGDATRKIHRLVNSVIDELDLRLPLIEFGLDSEVGVSGRRLSVQQRQKLGIARNLLKYPGLLIINEATGVLDSSSQSKILDAIKNAMKGKGLVWIADEVEAPDQFDRLFLAEAGKINRQSKQDSQD
jgi:putative ABC transport system ATP-binding protein